MLYMYGVAEPGGGERAQAEGPEGHAHPPAEGEGEAGGGGDPLHVLLFTVSTLKRAQSAGPRRPGAPDLV